MESKSSLKFYLGLGVAFVVSVLLIYREAIFQPVPAYTSKLHDALPNIKLRSEHAEVDLHEVLRQSGKKKAVLAMWATWCEPCIRELPSLQKAQSRLAQEDTAIILINYDGGLPEKTMPEVKAWLISRGLTLNTYFDFPEKLLEQLAVSALPFAVGVNADRKISWLELGELDWEKSVSVKN